MLATVQRCGTSPAATVPQRQLVAPELLAIKDALVGARQPISATALKQLKAFVTDPSASPLFGGDPVIARRAAGQLHRGFIRRPES